MQYVPPPFLRLARLHLREKTAVMQLTIGVCVMTGSEVYSINGI